jgi:hypothetical protein
MYEGRTRGKRMRYTYDDAEDEDEDENENFSDATSNRRSARQSGRNTPTEVGPQYTASGRQVKPRQGGEYGASLLSNQVTSPDELGPEFREDKEASDSEQPVRGGARAGRATRGGDKGGSLKKRKRINADDEDEGSLDDLSDDAPPSGDEWDSQANDDADDAMPDADEDSDLLEDEDAEPKSLVVTLKTNGMAKGSGTSPVVEAKPVEESAAPGVPKVESAPSAAADESQSASMHLQVQDADVRQTEYPTPTSTVAAATLVDKPLTAATDLKPQQSRPSKAIEDVKTNGTSVTRFERV